MNISLRGRTALVTGGSKGIGRAICERFLLSGAHVVALARRQEVLDETAAEIRETHGLELDVRACDVRDSARLQTILADICAARGGVDILVNNAASSMRRPFAELTMDDFRSDIDQKVGVAIQLAQAVLPHMREQAWGRILNIVSIFGKAPQPANLPTSVSRAAGIALTKTMSLDLAPFGVTANALCIGYVESDQWQRLFKASGANSYDEFIAERGRLVPLGRLGKAEEVANLACFLASDAASYITGTAINVDGGLSPVT
ncbi:MAG: SDR family oxidoreductase [Rhizobiaceae bacterium]|nr:SDR family oxidoreductase [Rhizobiaceae bacterium]